MSQLSAGTASQLLSPAPKISVITVCRNSAKTIAKTLQSVKTQSYCSVQHIIVDGASSDSTLEIVHHEIRAGGKIISEPDCGIYDAMNKGISLADGDVIAFLNADDHYAHDDVLAQVSQHFSNVRLEALFGDVAFFHPQNPNQLVRRYRSASFRPSRLRWGVMPAHPSTFIRQHLFNEVGLFRLDYTIAADFEMTIRMFLLKRRLTTFYPEILVHMATGGVSTSGWKAALTINRECVRACRENGIYTNQLMIMTKYARKIMELIT